MDKLVVIRLRGPPLVYNKSLVAVKSFTTWLPIVPYNVTCKNAARGIKILVRARVKFT